MSSKNFYGLTGDVTVDGGILNVGNAQLYANTGTSNVGIGTSNPEFELDVHGNANVGVLYSTFLHGDGSNIQNIVSSQWEGSPGDPIYYANNVGIANTSPVTKTLQVGSNLYMEDAGSNVLHVTGNIYADYFVGDGSQLTGIAATLDDIVDQGNTVSNTIQIVSGQDASSNIGLVTWEGVGISVSNANPTGEYQFGVGSNLLVNVYSSNVMTVDGNVFAQKMTLGTVTITPAYNLQQITETGATSNQTLVLSNVTTGLTADANIVVDGNVTAGSVITSGNVNAGNVITSSNIEVGGDLSVTGNVSVSNRLDVGSNLHIENLRVAEVASNLVTYDSTTGEITDSGGLFSNKLAVVSEQPPIALTGASTVVTNHGTYTIEASSGTVVNLFDKVIGESNKWETDGNYSTAEGTEGNYTGSASLAGHEGEWVKITMPYKTILRHIKIESTNESVEDIELVGLNADGLTWSNLKTETGLTGTTHTIIVNATTHHRTYGLIVEKTNTTTGRSAVEIGDLKLFTESFSIDGGKVEMASSAVMGGETTMDQHGPHSRGGAKLKKYPEIVFESGKFDTTANGTDSTYWAGPSTVIQGGYSLKTSHHSTDSGGQFGWHAFDGNEGTIWKTAEDYDVDGNYDYGYTSVQQRLTDTNSTNHDGDHVIMGSPNKLKIAKVVVTCKTASRRVVNYSVLGSNSTGTTGWTLLNSGTFNAQDVNIATITSPTTYFKYHAFVARSITADADGTRFQINSIDFYGYEEDPPTGDTSVDTTFTSIMNTPQTTGANVYVDGNLGETFTNRVTGPDATGTSATYDATGKYWELNGSLESNIAVEANTFLSGDQPHAVSVWFNSSNLEANVSNTCVFSISDQEKLDSVNLDLQSNTWHNLTYAYQGEGGSRVTYLDGRKVAEDQAEDTFGDYPPFAMTGYSQGGYVVSASSDTYSTTGFYAYKAFNDVQGNEGWHSGTGNGATNHFAANAGGSVYDASLSGGTSSPLSGNLGDWIKLEMPHKLVVGYVNVKSRGTSSASTQSPKDFKILGSNDDINWDILESFTSVPYSMTGENHVVGATKGYKYIAFLVTRIHATTVSSTVVGEISYYGHRENDLVRLPDPTNVLKYPHIAMTGQPGTANGVSDTVHAQRGYVVTASSMYVDNASNPYQPWRAFNNKTGGGQNWISTGLANTYGGGSGAYGTVRTANLGLDSGGASTPQGGTRENGEWLKVQLPHKIVLSHIQMVGNSADTSDHPKSFKLYGSINGTTWVEVISVTNTGVQDTSTGTTFTPGSTPDAYNYFGLVVTAIQSRTNYLTLPELRLFGTEENSSIPIQIGGGNIDKVANFRVYDKFVGEDQALEIWDAQKDAFGRAKSSMTLQKGRLGIGTTEPEGRLAVADEPHNLEEFPPRAMTGYKNYFEGHGEFCASASGLYDPTIYQPYMAFDKRFLSSINFNLQTYNSPSTYTGGNGVYGGTAKLGGFSGEWLQLELPYKINLMKFSLSIRGAWAANAPEDFVIAGYVEDTTSWVELASYTGEAWTGAGDNEEIKIKNINSASYYKRYALVTSKLKSSNNLNIAEWKLFGTREQGQSVLHDGQLTLTKSLNVPRIGPALDADDTPRRDRLVVEYNTSTNPTFEGAVRDTSGRGLDGVFYGTNMNYSSTEKAFEFNGTDDYTRSGILTNMSGDKTVSYSLWINADTLVNTMIVALGEAGVYGTNGKTGGIFMDSIGTLYNTVFANGIQVSGAITIGNWIHIVATKVPGGSGIDTQTLYVNGLKPSQSNWGTSGTSLSLDDPVITLGASPTLSQHFNGSISNFKLYDVALTAEEVKRLYDMGRCDEGHHVVNFSKTRVGIGLGDGEAPRGALDVRGNIIGGCPAAFSVAYNPTSLSGNQTIIWNLVYHNVGGGYNSSNGFFTAPVSGYYHFTVWGMTSSSTTGVVEFQFEKNGSTVQQRPYGNAGSNYGNATGSIIEYLNIGDTMSIFLTDSTTMYAASGQSYNGFSGFYLSS
jgi:hypothetical protein